MSSTESLMRSVFRSKARVRMITFRAVFIDGNGGGPTGEPAIATSSYEATAFSRYASSSSKNLLLLLLLKQRQQNGSAVVVVFDDEDVNEDDENDDILLADTKGVDRTMEEDATGSLTPTPRQKIGSPRCNETTHQKVLQKSWFASPEVAQLTFDSWLEMSFPVE
jgi:hypothetical protein